MELPRHPDLLTRLLEEISRWLAGHEPFAMAMDRFLHLILSGTDPERRASMQWLFNKMKSDVARKEHALKQPLDAFLAYFDEHDVELYRMIGTLQAGGGWDKLTLLEQCEGKLAATQQMITRVRKLRDEVIVRLDASMSERSVGQSPPGKVGTEHELRLSQGEVAGPLDREVSSVGEVRPALGSPCTVIDQAPVESQSRAGYLRLIFNEKRRSIERVGIEGELSLFKSRLSWGLAHALFTRGRDFSSPQELREVWTVYGKTDEPEIGTIRDALARLSHRLERLRVKVENGPEFGWRLEEIASEEVTST